MLLYGGRPELPTQSIHILSNTLCLEKSMSITAKKQKQNTNDNADNGMVKLQISNLYFFYMLHYTHNF